MRNARFLGNLLLILYRLVLLADGRLIYADSKLGCIKQNIVCNHSLRIKKVRLVVAVIGLKRLIRQRIVSYQTGFRHNQVSDATLLREQVNGCPKLDAGSELRLSDRCLQLRENNVSACILRNRSGV